jgi:hypothetical protein
VPTCVRETRESHFRPCGSARQRRRNARIVERDGKVLIEKSCPLHGASSVHGDRYAFSVASKLRFLLPATIFPPQRYPCITTGRRRSKCGRGAALTIDRRTAAA